MTTRRPNLHPIERWRIALVAVAVLANLACVCRVAAAASHPAGQSTEARPQAKHACCSRTEPIPREDPGHPPAREDRNCPHCGTSLLTLERPAQPDATKLEPAGWGDFADALFVAGLPCLPDHRSQFCAAGPLQQLPPAPTLLALHCALNL